MKSKDEMKFSWKDLAKALLYLFGSKRKIYLSWLAILFLIQFYGVLPPLVVGKIVDFFTNYSKGDSLNQFYIYSFFLGGSFSLISFIRLTIKKRLGNLRTDIIYDIRVKGFDKLLSLSLIETRNEAAGEKAQKIQSGVIAFKTILTELGNDIFSSIAAVIGIFFVFLFLKPSYILFLLVYIFGFVWIVKFFYSRIQKIQYEFYKAMEKGEGAYIEGLSNVLTIKALGAKQSFGSHIAKKEEIRRQFDYLGRRYGIGQWISFQVFNGICIAGFLLLVGRDVVLGAITLGSIVMFYGYLEQLTSSAGSLLRIYENIIRAKTGITRMMPIFWTKTIAVEGKSKFPKKWDKIQLIKADFDYQHKQGSENLIGISKVNFSVLKNEQVGIVGKTGSGKSTLAKLLLGLFPINSGKYQIGSKNFYDLKHDEVTGNVSLVLQETEMFNLTLKENITMMKKISPELFVKAIEVSQLKEVIKKLPEGVETLIGEKGYHLSGGERQRVGIARTICKDPQILIFDEATSSLDSKTEYLIQQALEKQLRKKTLIFIAHRVSTLKNVDRIYVFEQGKIVEEGKYQELINDSSSRFSKLYLMQAKSKA